MTQILPVISGLFYFTTLFFYFTTTCTDPGIIPRKSIDQIINEDSDTANNDSMNIDMNKFCTTCQIYKPIRSHHCKNCDNCVEVFDHHCPYINNCIGGRNYIYFFFFVLSATLLSLTDLCGCFIFIFNDYQTVGPQKPTCNY